MLPDNPNVNLEFKNENIRTIYLAGGCFWGTDAFMRRIEGVFFSETGYANGNCQNPSYEQVCSQTTNFAETVLVQYDISKITLEQIIDNYVKTINMFSINKQGEDVGSQYRTGIYYENIDDEIIILQTLAKHQANYEKKITIEVLPLINYFKAEEYHQDYLEKNPGGYCHVDLNLLNK